MKPVQINNEITVIHGQTFPQDNIA